MYRTGWMKKSAAGLVLFFLLSGTALLANGTSESRSTPSGTAGKITVLIPDWHKDLFEAAAEYHMEMNPATEVEVIVSDARQYNERFTVMIAAGTPPDMFVPWMNLQLDWIADDIDERLYKFGEREIAASHYPDVLRLCLEADPYSLPITVDAFGMAYNKEPFQRGGFRYPESMTWAELIYALQDFKEYGDVPVAADKSTAMPLFRLLTASDIESDNPGYFNSWGAREVSFESPAVMQMAGKIAMLNSFFPGLSSTRQYGTAWDEFFKEKKGAVAFTLFQLYRNRSNGDPDFGFAPFPAGYGREHAVSLYESASVALMKTNEARLRSALDFLETITSEEFQAELEPHLRFGSLWSDETAAGDDELFRLIASADYVNVPFSNFYASGEVKELQSALYAETRRLVDGEHSPARYIWMMEKKAEEIVGPLTRGARRYDGAELDLALTRLQQETGIDVSIAAAGAAGASGAAQSSRPADSSHSAGTSSPREAEKPRDTDGPRITIIYPEVASRGVDVEPQIKELRIIGRVADSSGIFEVTVNGTEAAVGSDGSFKADVRLAYGENRFTVTAEDVHANRTVRSFTIERATEAQGFSAPSEALSAGRGSGETGGEYHALLIGIEEYADRNISRLQYPIDDASELGGLLTRSYTFDRPNVTYLRNPTRQEILRQFETLRRSLGPDDNLLIYYAGHGYWDEQMRQGYWLPVDARKDDRTNWLSNSTVTDYLRA
ncbi:MAG: extracellular solute-binding protein, partial [Sediminispirochaetaceae bacterium]